MISLNFRAMGCQMAAFIDDDSLQAKQALDQVPVWFEAWEQALSRFRPESELSRLNAASLSGADAGQPFQTSPVLWEVLQAALHAAEWTSGLVTPLALNAVREAGYERSFEQIQAGGVRSQPAGQPVAAAPFPRWQEIHMDEAAQTVMLPAGAGLDFGGIAKGWAAQQAAQRLGAYGPALVDAGGDVAASGPRADGRQWAIAITDPLGFQTNLGVIGLAGGGVATSGIDRRRWLQGGQWKHHIIDPRTAQPAETDLVAVSALSPDLVMAEAAAKTILILGRGPGMQWLERQQAAGEDICALLAAPDGRVIDSVGMEDYLL